MGSRVYRVIRENLYHLSWEAEYERWVGTYWPWSLTDPQLRPSASGNSLDKLFLPGESTSSSFLQVCLGDEEEGEEGEQPPSYLLYNPTWCGEAA